MKQICTHLLSVTSLPYSIFNKFCDFLLQQSLFHVKYAIDPDQALGHGSFSKCYLCTRRTTGQRFAVKVMEKGTSVNVDREVQMLKMAQGSVHVVKLQEVLEDEVSILLKNYLIE